MRYWTREEDALLAQLWTTVAGSAEARCRELAHRFPGRTTDSLFQRALRLERLGRLDRRLGEGRVAKEPKPKSATCAGCDRHRWIHARGLCRGCFDRRKRNGVALPPVLKASLPAAPVPAATRPDPLACPFPPGSKGKVLWLRCRAEKGYWLWREGDAGGEAWLESRQSQPKPQEGLRVRDHREFPHPVESVTGLRMWPRGGRGGVADGG